MMNNNMIVCFVPIVGFLLMFSSYPEDFQDESSGTELKKTILTFYKEYINEQSINIPAQNKIDSLLRKYCTSKCICKIETLTLSGKLDYDPFLNAQDYSKETINTLKVSIISTNKEWDLCLVEYTWPSQVKKIIKVSLKVIKEKGIYKIDEVFLEGKLSYNAILIPKL